MQNNGNYKQNFKYYALCRYSEFNRRKQGQHESYDTNIKIRISTLEIPD